MLPPTPPSRLIQRLQANQRHERTNLDSLATTDQPHAASKRLIGKTHPDTFETACHTASRKPCTEPMLATLPRPNQRLAILTHPIGTREHATETIERENG